MCHGNHRPSLFAGAALAAFLLGAAPDLAGAPVGLVCKHSGKLSVPATLLGGTNLKVKNGLHPIGTWKYSEGTLEVLFDVADGSVRAIVVKLDGRTLKEDNGPRSREGEECAKSLKLAGVSERALEFLHGLLESTAEAGSCAKDTHFVLVHVSGNRYELQGHGSGGGTHYCGTYYF